jgi:hypothetical protein
MSGTPVLKASDPRLPEIVQRLKERKTNLLQESHGLGFTHNGQLRGALRRLIGEEQYEALKLNGAGKGRPRKKGCSPVTPAASEGSES